MTVYQSAIELLNLVKEESETIIVGYSGGKDSMVTLSLAIDVFGAENVKAFYLYFLKDMDSDKHFIRMAETRFDIEIIKLPHPEVGNYIKNGVMTKYSPELDSAIGRQCKWDDVERVARKRLDTRWIGYGHRMQDSLHRRGMLNKCDGFWHETYRVYPLYQWSTRDVYSFLRTKQLPIPSMFGATINNTSGLSLSAECLLFLRTNFPNDYDRVCKVFPYAKSIIYRDELRAKYNIQNGTKKA